MSVIGVVATLLAFFAASEIALVTADDLKVRAESERGERDSRMLDRLLARRDRLLALVLTGSNLATAVAAALLTSYLAGFGSGSSFLAPFILAPLSLLLGESMPKLLALRRPLSFARFVARPLRILAVAFAPLLWLETALSRSLRRLVGVSPDADDVFLTREDLSYLLRRRAGAAGVHQDAILPGEGRMIGRVLRFTHSEARKAMVPLVRVEAIPEDMTLAQAIEVVRREGFSRIPVFHRRIVD